MVTLVFRSFYLLKGRISMCVKALEQFNVKDIKVVFDRLNCGRTDHWYGEDKFEDLALTFL